MRYKMILSFHFKINILNGCKRKCISIPTNYYECNTDWNMIINFPGVTMCTFVLIDKKFPLSHTGSTFCSFFVFLRILSISQYPVEILL